MATDTATHLTWLTECRDVVVLNWPQEATEATRLDTEGIPHLLLVEPGGDPPLSSSCFEDWISLPATDPEIRTRLIGLARRAANHHRRPNVDALGHLTHRGGSAFLSPIDQRLAGALIERFGTIVTEPELIERVWPEGATNQALRVHVSRLRQRIASLGLTIKCVRGAGYLMTEEATNAAGHH